jgi:hypothetical protein
MKRVFHFPLLLALLLLTIESCSVIGGIFKAGVWVGIVVVVVVVVLIVLIISKIRRKD